MNHEAYISKVIELTLAKLPPEERPAFRAVYGAGAGTGARGVTYYNAWKPAPDAANVAVVELCACGEEHPTQLAGTTIHELGHVLAGHGAGHGPLWKAACERLGLRVPKAAGMKYTLSAMPRNVREFVASTQLDGAPAFSAAVSAAARNRPCSAGVGTRGGKSRGVGSGSRLRKWQCPCGVKARVASDDFQATCKRCGGEFKAS